MDLFWDKNESQLVCTVARGSAVTGYLVIDSSIGGHSSGGLRLQPDIDEGEMRGLARTMTLKYGFVGLPQGGAKAGVRGDPEAPREERREQLVSFAGAIAPLLRGGIYIPGADMGTDSADIRHMVKAVGVVVEQRRWRVDRTGYYTALTVFAGAKQAVRHLGLNLSGSTVAIEGFGKVGSSLATLLDGAGARVVAISTSRGAIFNHQGLDVKQLNELAAEAGSRVVDLYREAQRIDQTALLELPVDLLCPCARNDSLHVENAPRVAARILCPGANNPVTLEAERRLFEQGVLCLPDFVTNSGGVLGGRMEFASVGQQQIASFIDRHLGARIAWLLDESARQRVLPRDIAAPLALRRHEQLRQKDARPTRLNRLFQVGLGWYRRGWLPGPLVAALSLAYFERILAGGDIAEAGQAALKDTASQMSTISGGEA